MLIRKILVILLAIAGAVVMGVSPALAQLYTRTGTITTPGTVDMAVGPDGNVYMCDAAGVKVVSPTGATLKVIGGFANAHGICITPDGKIAVGDYWGQTVRVTDLNGNFLFSMGTGTTGENPGQFHMPRQVSYHPDGRFVVIDEHSKRVQFFNSDGSFHSWFVPPGSTTGQFGRPYDLAIDSEGNLWISDHDTNQVHKLNKEGQLLFRFSSTGGGPSQFFNCVEISIEGKRTVYVGERTNGSRPPRVKMFD